jgi:hypothetical protein
MAVYSGSTGDGGAPTNRFVLAWKPNLRDEPTEVEGTFTDDGAGPGWTSSIAAGSVWASLRRALVRATRAAGR